MGATASGDGGDGGDGRDRGDGGDGGDGDDGGAGRGDGRGGRGGGEAPARPGPPPPSSSSLHRAPCPASPLQRQRRPATSTSTPTLTCSSLPPCRPELRGLQRSYEPANPSDGWDGGHDRPISAQLALAAIVTRHAPLSSTSLRPRMQPPQPLPPCQLLLPLLSCCRPRAREKATPRFPSPMDAATIGPAGQARTQLYRLCLASAPLSGRLHVTAPLMVRALSRLHTRRHLALRLWPASRQPPSPAS
ncbi:hypothetical protein BS50DRAFT_585242 [Corynespora cassiicola Philippines]|uniref:Uncharacterized protein n=1 Tax=Corynespora cassiicola Philippines TaxID=1448308 RepID=A0A2T2NWA6_CORCC|nr:hypothetical protein BS50DRAFT_585242 [Corynespora cassiicola Philippines]